MTICIGLAIAMIIVVFILYYVVVANGKQKFILEKMGIDCEEE